MNLHSLFRGRRRPGVARFPFGQPGDPLLVMLPPHLEPVSLRSMIGSVSRYDALDVRFRPIHGNRGRLESIVLAMRAGVEFHPIEVYRLEGACYVIDGHHRVAAALEIGRLYLDAFVTECRLQREEAEDPLEEARVDFALRTGLRALTFGTLAGYARALGQIHEHRWYLGERGRVVGMQSAAEDWYETIYLPVVRQMIGARLALLQEPGEAGDLYMQLSDLKYRVSRERGQDIGFGQAIHMWAARPERRGAAELLGHLWKPGFL